MKRSPLHSAKPDAVSVCGKILKAGQTITVADSAIGERERKMATKGSITIRASNKKGQSQIVCTVGQK